MTVKKNRVFLFYQMAEIDPYDPALKYPHEWSREERIAALKCDFTRNWWVYTVLISSPFVRIYTF